jgi:hypothetical protein
MMNRRKFARSKGRGFANEAVILEVLYTKGDTILRDSKQIWVQRVIERDLAVINDAGLLSLTGCGMKHCQDRFPNLKKFVPELKKETVDDSEGNVTES